MLAVALSFAPLGGCFGKNNVKLHNDSGVSCNSAAVTINVLSNDRIGSNVAVDSVTVPNPPPSTTATVVVNSDNSITVAPVISSGIITFDYQVDYTLTNKRNDRTKSESATATVTVTVRDNNPPQIITNPISLSTNCGEPLFFFPSQNVSDPDAGDTLTVSAGTPTNGGTTSIVGTSIVQYTPPASCKTSATPINDTFTYTVTDQCGASVSGQVNVTVSAGVSSCTSGFTQVVDDSASTGVAFVGTWATVSGSGGFNDNYHSFTAAAGTGTNTATYQFTNLPPGQYQVQATWVADVDRATNVPYTVTGDSALTPVVVNQQVTPTADTVDGGVNFQNLTTVTLTSASTITVQIADGQAADPATGLIIADAVRIACTGAVSSATPAAEKNAAAQSTSTTSAGQSMTTTAGTTSATAVAAGSSSPNVTFVNNSSYEVVLFVGGVQADIVQPYGTSNLATATGIQMVQVTAIVPGGTPRETLNVLTFTPGVSYTLTYTDNGTNSALTLGP